MNKKVNILLRHPIISTIIGTVIAGLILTFLSRALTSVWVWIVNIFEEIKDFLFLKVRISVWLLIILLLFSIQPLFKIVKGIISYFAKENKMKSTPQSPEKQKTEKGEKNKYNQESSMSNEEKYILALLTKVDGRALTFSEIQKGINCSNIRTRNAIDKLKKKYLIKSYGGPYHPEAYVLTEGGREFVIGFNLDEKLKNT